MKKFSLQCFSVGSIYNSWRIATVYIYVIDVNDNSPKWVIPVYPRQNDETKNKYFGLYQRNKVPDQLITTIAVSCRIIVLILF